MKAATDTCRICGTAIEPTRRRLQPATKHCGKDECRIAWGRHIRNKGARRRRREQQARKGESVMTDDRVRELAEARTEVVLAQGEVDDLTEAICRYHYPDDRADKLKEKLTRAHEALIRAKSREEAASAAVAYHTA